jgi:hypothetical protein
VRSAFSRHDPDWRGLCSTSERLLFGVNQQSKLYQEYIMKRFTRPLLVLAAITTFGTAGALAQEVDDSERKIIYKSRTEIDFEGVDVAGELVKPQGALLLDRKKGSFNPLIRLREEFNLEMENSVNYIK